MGVDISFMGWKTVKEEYGWLYQENEKTGERRVVLDNTAQVDHDQADIDKAWLGDGLILC